jgi:phage-related protein (TIGR01555 family)
MSDKSRGAGGGKSLTARVFDGMQNLIAALGTSRDKRSFGTYTLCLERSQMELDAIYSSSWLADKIVSVIPDDMTREWVDLSWDGLDERPEDKKLLKDAVEMFDLRGKVNEAAKWGRLYGGAVILILIAGEDPRLPLDIHAVKKGSLKLLDVSDRHLCTADAVYGTTDDGVGMPLYYREALTGLTFHWSRVIRFEGRLLTKQQRRSNQGWNGSVLGPVMDSIKDYDFTRTGIASMVYEANVDIISVDGLYDILATDDGEARLTKRFTSAGTLKSYNHMLLIDKEKESHGQKTTSFSGVNEVLEKFMVDVSGAADVPITRLFGRSPGGLNATGDSDAANYDNHVAAKQMTHLRRPLKVLFEVIARSTFGTLPENFDFTFRPLSQMSSTEKATIQKTNADRDKIYVDLGVLTEGAIARQLKDENVYSTLEEEDVEMAEELAGHPDVEPEAPSQAAEPQS